MRKSEVVTRGSAWRGGALPALNVKVYKSARDITPAEWTELQSEFGDGFTYEWITEHLTDEAVDAWWMAACEDHFELAQSDASEVFDRWAVRCELDGRSGGWLVMRGLPDMESWDATILAKWARFARYCASIVDDVPRACAWYIGANVYETELETFERAESTRDDINADALSALKVG